VCVLPILQGHLPNSVLGKLFPPGCAMGKLVIERTNATADYAAQLLSRERKARDAPNGSLGGFSWNKFLKLRKDWDTRVSKVSPRTRTHRVAFEEIVRASASGEAGREAEAQLLDVFGFLDVRREDQLCLYEHCISVDLAAARGYREASELTTGYEWHGDRLTKALTSTRLRLRSQAQAAPSMSAARVSLHSARWSMDSLHHGERKFAIGFAAGGSFVLVTLAGSCLALGIAIGQRVGHTLREGMAPLEVDSPGGVGSRLLPRGAAATPRDDSPRLPPDT